MSKLSGFQKQHIENYYSNLIDQYGDSSGSCDYGGDKSQRIKFNVLDQLMDLNGKRILEVGCGLAHFYDFLQEKHQKIEYHGVDITPKMIDLAKQRHPLLSLRTLDILEQDHEEPYDYVIAQGIFYLIPEKANETTEKLIRRMWDLSSEAVAINTLSSRAENKEIGKFYPDPLWLLDVCLKITPYVTLRHDYMSHDCTICLYSKPTQIVQ